MNEENNKGGPPRKPDICRKFVWGKCDKFDQCRFRHELNFHEMKKILKFCHNFQNKTGCSGENCTYIHATREEQALFNATGALPQVLVERHTAMAAAANMPMFVAPPPPPPPPPSPNSLMPPPPPPPPPRAYTPTHTPAQPPARPHPPQHHIMPPPPPPPPTTQQQSYPARNQFPSTSSVSSSNISFASSSSDIPMFDASQPPPPLPQSLTNSYAVKRKFPCFPATTRKHAKFGQIVDCQACIQRDIRLSELKEQIDKMLTEVADRNLILERKQREYEREKAELLARLPPHQRRAVDDFLESIPPPPDRWSQPQSQRNSQSTESLEAMVMSMLSAMVQPQSNNVASSSTAASTSNGAGSSNAGVQDMLRNMHSVYMQMLAQVSTQDGPQPQQNGQAHYAPPTPRVEPPPPPSYVPPTPPPSAAAPPAPPPTPAYYPPFQPNMPPPPPGVPYYAHAYAHPANQPGPSSAPVVPLPGPSAAGAPPPRPAQPGTSYEAYCNMQRYTNAPFDPNMQYR